MPRTGNKTQLSVPVNLTDTAAEAISEAKSDLHDISNNPPSPLIIMH